jgi:CRP/FNR family cyclic AMP-dependent transcriptional regulator
MSARAKRARAKGGRTKFVTSVESVRPAKSPKGGIAKPTRLRTPRRQRTSDMAFDPAAFLTRAGLGRKIVSLKKGHVAYSQGDSADAIFYVQKGRLKVTVTSPHGKEATIGLVDGGEFLGEDCMVSAHPLRLARATAMTECALLRITKAEMVRVLHREQSLSEVFVAFLLARNARFQADLVDQLFNSSEKRLARILLLLAQFGKESKPETVVPQISQEILAEMIGTTRSRVNLFMNRFRRLGFIEYNGEIQVHNSLLNIFLQE